MYSENLNKQPSNSERSKKIVKSLFLTAAVLGAIGGTGKLVSEGTKNLQDTITNNLESSVDRSGIIKHNVRGGEGLRQIITDKLKSGEIQDPDNLGVDAIELIAKIENSDAFSKDGHGYLLMGYELILHEIYRKAVK